MKHLLAAVFVLSGSTALAGPIPIVYDPPTDITVTDLGSLGGVWSEAYDINNRGIVVGWSNDAAGVGQAFYYLDGAMRLLDAGIGPHSNIATGINDRDEIVGAFVHFGEARAFLADVGSSGVLALLDRGHPDDRGINSTAAAISDSSLVVGQRDVPGEQVANIWPDLYTFRTVEREAVVNDVNSAGVTVGYSTYDTMIFVWRWSKDKVIEECMPQLEPAISCFSSGDLLGINDRGEIVGYTDHGFDADRAIYWDGHSVFSRQLGLLPTGTHSIADDINEDGFITGYADRVTGGFKLSLDTAFLFHWDFGMVALPRPKSAAWFGHCRAKALNDRNAATGVIQVVGTCDTLLGTNAVRWDMKVRSRLLVPPP